MEKIEKLQPRAFTRFCMTIGAVPSSYLEGMTVERQLLWFCSYLEKEVIPAVNQAGKAVEELQALYTQLLEYVNNYFDNLDVQEEINNKLDDMAEDGTLAEIIAQYVQLNGVLAYNTKALMKAAENLIDGSIAYTIGETTYNDGKCAFYKIREIQNTDVVDDYNIVALNNSETLIAERLPNYYLNEINNRITNDINEINDRITTVVNLVDNNVPTFSNSFGTTNQTLLSATGQKYIEPFVVFDKEHNKYLMFFSDCGSTYAMKRAESTNLIGWNVVSNNIVDGAPTNRHKFNILVDIKGNPIKINNKYHGYAVSNYPKKIYHYETTNLNSTWTETGIALDYNNDNTDNYGVDAPCAIYDEINNKCILYYMGLSSTTNTSYINRAESNSPSTAFTYQDTILSPTSNTWYSGWLGGMQVLNTSEGLKVIFNGSSSVPSAAGAEPNPSLIGMGQMESLYSSINANNYPTIINEPNTINSQSVWRGHVIFNKTINKYVMFYNTGDVAGDEVITYAIEGFMGFEAAEGYAGAQYLNSTDEVLINGAMKYVTPGFYNIKIGVKCSIGGSTGMKNFRVRFRTGQDDDLTTISSSDQQIFSRNCFIGNYAWQNDVVILDVYFMNNSATYKKIYATVQLVEGDTANNPAIEDVRFYITQA